jgi:hypothetical protein
VDGILHSIDELATDLHTGATPHTTMDPYGGVQAPVQDPVSMGIVGIVGVLNFVIPRLRNFRNPPRPPPPPPPVSELPWRR